MGEGTDLTDFDALTSKARRKLITFTMASQLIEIAKEHKAYKWVNRFENTLRCQDEMITSGGRSYSLFCCNRCCTICLANRKAEKINMYLPELLKWPDPHFLTLTVVSVKKERLEQRVGEIGYAIRRIIARHKKRHQREKERKFYGIWVLESNFNPIRKTYNPHLHLLLPDKHIAEILKLEWMLFWQSKGIKISKKAQKYRKAKKDRKKDLMEMVKYGSKIFTEPDIKKKLKQKGPSFIYTAALFNILRAMDGHHIFNTFGFKLEDPPVPQKKSTNVSEYTQWEYDRSIRDWVSHEYKRRLTDYTPPTELEELLEYRVNNDLE